MFQAIIYSVKGIKQNLHVTGSSDCFLNMLWVIDSLILFNTSWKYILFKKVKVHSHIFIVYFACFQDVWHMLHILM